MDRYYKFKDGLQPSLKTYLKQRFGSKTVGSYLEACSKIKS